MIKQQEVDSSKTDNEVLEKSVEKLLQQNKELTEKNKLLENKIKENELLALADYQNLQRRTAQEVRKSKDVITVNIISDVLSVLDDLERMLNNVRKEEEKMHFVVGAQMLKSNIMKLLDKFHIHVIDSPAGDDFDYKIHNIIGKEDHDKYNNDQIIKTVYKGYKLGNTIIRHQAIIVAK